MIHPNNGPFLIDVQNKPAALCQRPLGGDGFYIGPTAIDHSMLPSPVDHKRESVLLKNWKNQDLAAHYRVQRSNKFR